MKLSIPCFSNLRTSALIIGYTELFFIGAMFTYNWNGTSIRAVFDILVIIMVSCWLYGIFEKNRKFMLPHLIVSIIFCVFILGVLILTSFAVLFASLSVMKIDYSESQQSDILVTQGLFDVSLITFALQSFCTVIKYSLYTKMGEDVYMDLPRFQTPVL